MQEQVYAITKYIGVATTSRSTMGWFHGFKLHIIINDKGKVLNFIITQANVDDRQPLRLDKIYGKLFADKGYIGKNLMQILFIDGVQLITSVRAARNLIDACKVVLNNGSRNRWYAHTRAKGIYRCPSLTCGSSAYFNLSVDMYQMHLVQYFFSGGWINKFSL